MPVNGSALSRIYTLNNIVTRVLSRLGVSSPEDNLKPKIVAEINAQQKIIAGKLIAEDKSVEGQYSHPASISFVSGEQTFDNIEVTNPLIVEVKELRAITDDAQNYGTVPYLIPEVFRNASNNLYYDNGIFHTVENRRVKLFSGQNIDATGYTYQLIYTREVNTLSSPSDLMDLPNGKFDELVNAVLEQFATPSTETTE